MLIFLFSKRNDVALKIALCNITFSFFAKLKESKSVIHLFDFLWMLLALTRRSV